MAETTGGFSDNMVYFAGLLTGYLNSINLTRRLLEEVPNAALPRVGWDQVIVMGQNFFAEATRVGVLWTGDHVSDISTLDDNMQEFFGLLQRVIILAHGATRDAGSTLENRIRITMDKFVDVSFNLFKEAVFSYDSEEERGGDVISNMIVSVWESFDALKKIPPDNVTAIGEAIDKVAFSVEYNLRILKGLNEAYSDDPPNEMEDKTSGAEGSDAKELKKDSSDPPEKFKDRASGAAEIDTKDQQKKGSSDPPEKFQDRASGAEGSDGKEVEKGSCDPPEKFEDRASGAAEIDTKVVKKGSSDPPEKFKDRASGAEGSNAKEVEKGSCDPPEEFEDMASGAAEIDTKDQQKKGSCAPPEKVEDRASGAEEIDTKDQQKKDSCDPSEEFEDMASGAAEIDTKDQQKKGSCAPPEKVEDRASGAEEIDTKDQQKKDSCDPPEKVKDRAPGAEEIDTKDQQEKGSCDPPEKVEDRASGAAEIDTKEVEKGSCDPPEKFKDRASSAEGSDTKEVEKGSCEVTDKACGDADPKELKNSSCDPPEEMDIARLTIDAVSAIHDMLIHLSPIAIGLEYKEKEGTIPNFVDFLENILERCKVIASQTEEFIRPDQALSVARSVAPINIYAAMRDLTAIFHGVGGSLHRSSEFAQAWYRSIRLIKQLGAEFRKRSESDDHLVSHVKKLGLMSFW